MQEGTFNFIALILISSLPNPSMNQLPIGLHIPSLSLSLLQSYNRSNSSLEKIPAQRRQLGESLFQQEWWNPAYYKLSYSVKQNSGEQRFTDRLTTIHLQSDWLTLFTHLFVHKDGSHLFNNIASISTSASFLDLGFLKSTFLFLWSGMGGVLGLGLESITRSDQDKVSIALSSFSYSTNCDSNDSWIKAIFAASTELFQSGTDFLSSTLDQLTSNMGIEIPSIPSNTTLFSIPFLRIPIRSFTAFGSSAAAFGFLGVEVFYLCKEISRIWDEKYTRLQRYRAEEKMAVLIFQSVWKIGQVCFMLEGIGSGSGPFVISIFGKNDGDVIGHAAHLGGFVSGLLVAPFLLN